MEAKSIVSYHIGAFLKVSRKTTKYLNRNKLQDPDLKPELPEYEAGVPTISSGVWLWLLAVTVLTGQNEPCLPLVLGFDTPCLKF
jgi:hypothetical protein